MFNRIGRCSRISLRAAVLAALFVASGPLLSHGGVRHDFRLAGGLWFDGKTFVPRTVYTVAGVFRDAWDGPVEATLDLSGKYVVAPYGDAHTHDLGGGPNPEDRLRDRLRQGVFYVQNTNNIPKWTEPFRSLVNKPESVDVAYANGGLTATGGHPVQIYDKVAEHPPLPGWTKADMPDQAYFIVDDAAAFEAKWPLILAGRPDFVKVYLEHSDEFAKRRSDPVFFGRRGLDPALLPSIVERAHAAGVPIAFGVDGHPPLLAEVENVRRLGVFDNAELLRMLTETTPRAIFPSRKIGCLAAGCEASFLALDGNPPEDFSSLKKIAVRMKQGFVLRLEPASTPAGPPH